ncbi:hypothetical protein JG688_00014068 [Phytophthora aleatoria]|uniref:HAT C-terminal dimerisation domain-containing protein n=1 Tax=Phytophthora aleatoria TaxID=2496075 RepID=A0A8J5MDM5_9STRA|nr:hypothetical protein JG688_00014068 [Phytophthora aleatoria]
MTMIWRTSSLRALRIAASASSLRSFATWSRFPKSFRPTAGQCWTLVTCSMGMLGVQPTFRSYLAPDAPIVHSPKFDSAIVKVLGGKQEDPSFAESILKRRKVDAAPSTYTFLAAIPPTSNVAERLFSSARAVLRHEHHRLSPMALEMILFLKEKQLVLLSMLACNREPKAYISFCELNNILLQHPCIFSYLFCR